PGPRLRAAAGDGRAEHPARLRGHLHPGADRDRALRRRGAAGALADPMVGRPAQRAGGGDAVMFEGFDARRVDVDGTSLHVRMAGRGPAVLLLHGYPQTHAMWHRVAPRLAERFTVVVPDLRGYGD